MDVTPLIPEDRQVIDSYGPARFRIANVVYVCSVIVFPDRTIEWPVATIDEVLLDSLAPVIDAKPSIEVLYQRALIRTHGPIFGVRST